MKSAMKLSGTAGGYVGSAICLLAILGRFFGRPHVFGWDATNMLLLGMAVVLMACWAKLEAA